MTLFLERITPSNLMPRIKTGTLNAKEFQQVLLNEIRAEFNHNAAQQVYMSQEAWDMIKNAKEDLIVTINNSAAQLSDEASESDLSRKIFETTMETELDAIGNALRFIKDEIQQYF
jgi:predicted AlkP superfamily phosphohydrolase/phosphomutase